MHIKYLISIFFILSLAACGGGSSSNSDPGINPPTNVEPEPEPKPEPEPMPEGGNFTRGSLGDNDSVPEINCSSIVTSTSALEDAVSYEMAAGTTLCLAAGDYTGLELQFGGIGTVQNPITVAAETSGAVTIGGEVGINMGGEYVVLQGFVFKDGTSASSDILQTRGDSNQPCNHCRITEISIIDFDEDSDDSSKWLNIYGANNRVDHNWFAGKNNRGALLIIDRGLDSNNGQTVEDMEEDRAQIDHNYFGDRPPIDGKAYADNGDNEFEAVRLGSSDSHTGNSFSVVEYNYFERIQGEAEVISNKSGNNSIRNNTVRDSYGSITTRHGSSATISGNFMLGDDHPFAAGLRIIDDGHTIVNNYIQGARYQNTTHHGGIVLMGADGNDTNGYQQFENVLIAHNTIVDSVNSLNVDGGKKATNPRDVYLLNNIIANGIGPVITQAADGMPGNSTIGGNIFYGTEFSDSDSLTTVPGISFTDAVFQADALGVYRPGDFSPDLAATSGLDSGSFAAVTEDMDGHMRSAATLAGADEVSQADVTNGVLTYDDVGPLSYRPPMSKGYVKSVAIENHDFDAQLTGWTNNGAILTTDASEVFSRGVSIKLDSTAIDISQQVTIETDTNYTLSAFVKGYGSLQVTVAGVTYREDLVSTEKYKLATVSFDSGSETRATITAKLDDLIPNSATILNPDFTNSQDNWIIVEGTGIGQVQDSSNSASGANGSTTLKYNADDSGTPNPPSISQAVGSILTNTDYSLSMYLLEKNGADAKVKFGVYADDGSTVVAQKVSDYRQLELDGAAEGDDGFLQDTLTFNSGSNTTLVVFAEYQGDGSEVRVDDFTLRFEGAPAAGASATFDSFRLVSHKNLD